MFNSREQQLKNEAVRKLAEADEGHRKELMERDLASKEIFQALEDIKKDIHLEQERAKAAKLKADEASRRTEETQQSLKACEGKLSTSIEDRQKWSQANAQISKELAEVCRLEQDGLAEVVKASHEASKRIKQLNPATPPPTLEDPCRSMPTVA